MGRPTAGSAMGGGRAFVDATGTPVPLGGPIGRVVATDPDVGALLLGLGARLVGCAGELDGADPVGGDRSPDPERVRAAAPDVIVTGVAGGRHDLADPAVLGPLRRIAPVVAVDPARPAVSAADLRALLGTVAPPAHRSAGRHER